MALSTTNTLVYINAKTLWLLQPHLGCLSCISVTKECYQIGFLEGSLRSFFISYCNINFSEDLFGNIPGNTTTTMQPTNSPEADVYKNNKPHQKCWFIGFLKGDTDLAKEGSFSSKLFQIVSIP